MSDFSLGNELLRNGKVQEAVAAYQKAIAHHPRFPWYHYKLGEALSQLGRWDEAIAHYQTAIEIEPRSKSLKSALAEALAATKTVLGVSQINPNYDYQDLPPSPPPKEMLPSLICDFTLNNKIPVLHHYYNNTRTSPIVLSMTAYQNVFNRLETGSFKYYGKTLHHLLNAFDKYSIVNKNVLIFGLNRVNCDAISIWKGAANVYVIDYNLPVSEHPQVQVFSTDDYIGQNIKADAAISISSFEHDGLGRYGDPINPTGDFEAMKLAKKFIKKDGLLFFSVPVGQDCLVWNAHRIYGKIRLPMMLEGWKTVDSFGFSESLIVNKPLGAFSYEQPVFVLQNL
ncbi:DUF268 domain-containing protein [Limnospira fusiformis KN01]|uniref:DUF268 domain-containing protein n=1 Tax=Limnospira fusiformis TaxID=54297 RepID=UPI001F386019|nr:DUF268 domain-containing protein [Limnospira fusiformis]ULB45246.1 DUF268 domain-containing protein [Limnospira fusiformis KN01]